MNVQKGLRRLGLVVGILGGMAAGVVMVMLLDQTNTKRADFKKFELLVAAQEEGKQIYLSDQTGEPIYVVLKNGKSVSRPLGQPPTLRDYLLPITLPFIGFLVPWGVVKAIRWILLGFTSRPKGA